MSFDASFKWTFSYSFFDITYLDALAAVAAEGSRSWIIKQFVV